MCILFHIVICSRGLGIEHVGLGLGLGLANTGLGLGVGLATAGLDYKTDGMRQEDYSKDWVMHNGKSDL